MGPAEGLRPGGHEHARTPVPCRCLSRRYGNASPPQYRRARSAPQGEMKARPTSRLGDLCLAGCPRRRRIEEKEREARRETTGNGQRGPGSAGSDLPLLVQGVRHRFAPFCVGAQNASASGRETGAERNRDLTVYRSARWKAFSFGQLPTRQKSLGIPRLSRSPSSPGDCSLQTRCP